MAIQCGTSRQLIGWCNRLFRHRRLLCVVNVFVISVTFTVWINNSLSGETAMLDDVTRSDAQPQEFNSSALCTSAIFRDYYAKWDYFPGGGRWVTDIAFSSRNVISTIAGSSGLRLDRYQPDICTFKYGGKFRQMPPETLRRCFRLKHIRSVTTMGDSNGAHHFDALVAMLNQTENGNTCAMTARESVDSTLLIPDVRYYARHDPKLLPVLRATHRHCSSCVSRTARCSMYDVKDGGSRRGTDVNAVDGELFSDDRKFINLEHLSMVSVLDSSVKIDIPHNHFAVNLQYRADTYQEFLLKHYLRGRYPDLLIIFPPFNHDKKSLPKSSLSIRLRYFIDLLDLYLPPTTQVIWIPSFAEFESRKPPVWANRRMHGLLGTAKIDQFNRELYRLLRSSLLAAEQRQPSPAESGVPIRAFGLRRAFDEGQTAQREGPRVMHGFFDQIRVSETRADLSVDGVHMTGEWYAEIMSYILQVLCSDVIADDVGR